MINLSHSAISCYAQCPRRYKYKYLLRLDKIDEGASEHHLVYGKAFHEALKKLYLGGKLEHAIEVFKAEYPTQLDEADLAKTQANGILALTAYQKRWAEEDKKWKVIAVEDKQSFVYGEEDLVVQLDLIVENIAYGGIYGLDHKVVGGKRATLSYDFWNQFEPNAQVTKYYSYIKDKYGDCSGFYINAIGMGYRQRAYKGEPAGFWYRMERQMFNRNEAQLRDERLDTASWAEKIRGEKQYPMNTDSCRFCSYRPVCAAGWTWEEDSELILIQYQQRPLVTNKGESNAVSGSVPTEGA